MSTAKEPLITSRFSPGDPNPIVVSGRSEEMTSVIRTLLEHQEMYPYRTKNLNVITGQVGIGKSTFMGLLKQTIQSNKELSQYIPIYISSKDILKDPECLVSNVLEEMEKSISGSTLQRERFIQGLHDKSLQSNAVKIFPKAYKAISAFSDDNRVLSLSPFFRELNAAYQDPLLLFEVLALFNWILTKSNLFVLWMIDHWEFLRYSPELAELIMQSIHELKNKKWRYFIVLGIDEKEFNNSITRGPSPVTKDFSFVFPSQSFVGIDSEKKHWDYKEELFNLIAEGEKLPFVVALKDLDHQELHQTLLNRCSAYFQTASVQTDTSLDFAPYLSSVLENITDAVNKIGSKDSLWQNLEHVRLENVRDIKKVSEEFCEALKRIDEKISSMTNDEKFVVFWKNFENFVMVKNFGSTHIANQVGTAQVKVGNASVFSSNAFTPSTIFLSFFDVFERGVYRLQHLAFVPLLFTNAHHIPLNQEVCVDKVLEKSRIWKLNNLSDKDVSYLVRETAAKSGVVINEEVTRDLFAKTEGLPYTVQHFGHYVLDQFRKTLPENEEEQELLRSRLFKKHERGVDDKNQLLCKGPDGRTRLLLTQDRYYNAVPKDAKNLYRRFLKTACRGIPKNMLERLAQSTEGIAYDDLTTMAQENGLEKRELVEALDRMVRLKVIRSQGGIVEFAHPFVAENVQIVLNPKSNTQQILAPDPPKLSTRRLLSQTEKKGPTIGNPTPPSMVPETATPPKLSLHLGNAKPDAEVRKSSLVTKKLSNVASAPEGDGSHLQMKRNFSTRRMSNVNSPVKMPSSEKKQDVISYALSSLQNQQLPLPDIFEKASLQISMNTQSSQFHTSMKFLHALNDLMRRRLSMPEEASSTFALKDILQKQQNDMGKVDLIPALEEAYFANHNSQNMLTSANVYYLRYYLRKDLNQLHQASEALLQTFPFDCTSLEQMQICQEILLACKKKQDAPLAQNIIPALKEAIKLSGYRIFRQESDLARDLWLLNPGKVHEDFHIYVIKYLHRKYLDKRTKPNTKHAILCILSQYASKMREYPDLADIFADIVEKEDGPSLISVAHYLDRFLPFLPQQNLMQVTNSMQNLMAEIGDIRIIREISKSFYECAQHIGIEELLAFYQELFQMDFGEASQHHFLLQMMLLFDIAQSGFDETLSSLAVDFYTNFMTKEDRVSAKTFHTLVMQQFASGNSPVFDQMLQLLNESEDKWHNIDIVLNKSLILLSPDQRLQIGAVLENWLKDPSSRKVRLASQVFTNLYPSGDGLDKTIGLILSSNHLAIKASFLSHAWKIFHLLDMEYQQNILSMLFELSDIDASGYEIASQSIASLMQLMVHLDGSPREQVNSFLLSSLAEARYSEIIIANSIYLIHSATPQLLGAVLKKCEDLYLSRQASPRVLQSVLRSFTHSFTLPNALQNSEMFHYVYSQMQKHPKILGETALYFFIRYMNELSSDLLIQLSEDSISHLLDEQFLLATTSFVAKSTGIIPELASQIYAHCCHTSRTYIACALYELVPDVAKVHGLAKRYDEWTQSMPDKIALDIAEFHFKIREKNKAMRWVNWAVSSSNCPQIKMDAYLLQKKWQSHIEKTSIQEIPKQLHSIILA